MKDTSAAETLRKSQKYLTKVFKNEDDNDHTQIARQLLSIIKDKRMKTVIDMYDGVTTEHQPETEDLNDAVVHVLDEQLYSLSESNPDAEELCMLLSGPHMRSLVEAHDTIASKDFEEELPPEPDTPPPVAPDSPGLGYIGGGDMFDPVLPRATSSGSDLAGSLGGDSPGMARRRLLEGTMKMVGIQKEPGEQMGITVIRRDEFSPDYGPMTDIIVERIMAGSRIEEQGVLHPGDIIREVNGVSVDSPEILQKLFRQSNGNLTLKVISASREKPQHLQLHLRAHFTYDPNYDNLIPCKEAGISFSTGDVLEICSQEDHYWWQARKFGTNNRAGLIPSTTLQERRKAFIQSAPDPNEITYKMFGCGLTKRKKKAKIMFKANEAEVYENTDLVVYEEVGRIPGFKRNVICFLGAPGVGRHTLISNLIKDYPDRYASALPHTSRPLKPGEKRGDRYFFTNRREMETDIAANKYVEVGEFNDNLYGTKMSTIRDIVRGGHTCLLECSESAAKRLRIKEFMPYIVFVASPTVDCMRAMYEYGRSMDLTDKYKRDEDFRASVDRSVEMERAYRHLFDFVVVNDNMDVTYNSLRTHLDEIMVEPQWVPVIWLY